MIWFVFDTLEKTLSLSFFTASEYFQGHSSLLWWSTCRYWTISATPVCFGTTFSTESCLHFSTTCHTERNYIELTQTCNVDSFNFRMLSYLSFFCCRFHCPLTLFDYLNSIILFCFRKSLLWINVLLIYYPKSLILIKITLILMKHTRI